MDVKIYGQPRCRRCEAAKHFCERMNISYTYIDITAGDITSDDVKHLTTVIAPGAKTVPIVVIDGKWIGGYDHLVEHFTGM